jgi:hypothetical protein
MRGRLVDPWQTLRHPFFPLLYRVLSRERFFDETLMVASCPPAIDAGVRPDRHLEIFVAQQLPNGFKAAGLGIKQDLRAEMSKLMSTDHDARSPL